MIITHTPSILVRAVAGAALAGAIGVGATMPGDEATAMTTFMASPSRPLVVLAAVEEKRTIGPDFTADTVRQSALVSRIQDVLSELGIYSGPADGELTPTTERAIRIYESQVNLAVTGRATRELLDHLETVGRSNKLLVRLSETRDRKQEAARQVLLSSEVADRLKSLDDRQTANPLRDPSACFASPTPGCLLDEGFESARAIGDTKFRDWALGDVAVARAVAGATDEVFQTVRLIDDPRLVVAALRDAAIAWATRGETDDARELISGMPNPMFAAEILSAIAVSQARNGDSAAVGRTLGELLTFAGAGSAPSETISLLAGLAPKLFTAGAEDAAKQVLQVALDNAHDATIEPLQRDRAMGEVAAIYVRLGQADTGRALMAKIENSALRRPVLMALAESSVESGEGQDALLDAEDVTDSRYRVVALSYVAIAQARVGNIEGARASIAQARSDSTKIDARFTYAKAFAVSRIAAALAEMRGYDDAASAASEIEDGGLRAQSFWHLASVQARDGSTASVQTRSLALQATESITSDLDRSWTLSRLALSSAARGEWRLATTTFDAALAIAQGISNSFARATALANLATTLVQLDRAPQR